MRYHFLGFISKFFESLFPYKRILEERSSMSQYIPSNIPTRQFVHFSQGRGTTYLPTNANAPSSPSEDGWLRGGIPPIGFQSSGSEETGH
jgi:hypothetical protein